MLFSVASLGIEVLQSFPLRCSILLNIRKLECGVMDKELFKKLENSEIWELRTLFNGIFSASLLNITCITFPSIVFSLYMQN